MDIMTAPQKWGQSISIDTWSFSDQPPSVKYVKFLPQDSGFEDISNTQQASKMKKQSQQN